MYVYHSTLAFEPDFLLEHRSTFKFPMPFLANTNGAFIEFELQTFTSEARNNYYYITAVTLVIRFHQTYFFKNLGRFDKRLGNTVKDNHKSYP